MGGASDGGVIAQDGMRLCDGNAGDRAGFLLGGDSVIRDNQWDDLEQLYVMFLR